ncbi:MAG: AAA family ATPase [Sutterella sp.]
MIVAVASTKGGTGKTTTAVQLALYRKLVDGRDVWLVDGDEQESSATAISIRSDSEVEPPLPCSAYSDGRQLITQVRAQKDKWSDVIIDVGGRATDTLRAALMVCDVLLVPVQPRSYDIWALAKLQKIIETARTLGATFRPLVFLSCADAQGGDNQEAADAMKAYPELHFIDSAVVRRKAISVASSSGISVFEARPKDAKACAEIEALAKAVFAD